MTAKGNAARVLAGGVAWAMGLVLTVHVSIVSAFAGSSGEAVLAIVLGGTIVLVLIGMWVRGWPSGLAARTAACLGMFAAYLVLFVLL